MSTVFSSDFCVLIHFLRENRDFFEKSAEYNVNIWLSNDIRPLISNLPHLNCKKITRPIVCPNVRFFV